MEENNLQILISQAKNSPKTPMQKVEPISNKENKVPEIQIAFYLPKSLYKKVKMVALEKELSIKSILNESIENYIKDIS